MTRQPIGLHAVTHLPGGSDPIILDTHDSVWFNVNLSTFTKNTDHPVNFHDLSSQVAFGGYPGVDTSKNFSGIGSAIGRTFTYDNTASPTTNPVTIREPGFYLVASSLLLGHTTAYDNPFYMGIEDNWVGSVESFTVREDYKSQRFDNVDAWGPPETPDDPFLIKSEFLGLGTSSSYGLTVRHTNSTNPAGTPAAVVTVWIVRILAEDT